MTAPRRAGDPAAAEWCRAAGRGLAPSAGVEEVRIPEAVRAKARVVGAGRWLAALPGLVRDVELEWRVTAGEPFPDATEAWVAPAGADAVIKLMVPRPGDHARHEITALRRAGGDGMARLLRCDRDRGAMLLERLGPSLADSGVPAAQRLLAEPEYDLGVLMREDPVGLVAGDPWDRARYLAARTGTDVTAVWEWGAAERVSTGLVLTSIGMTGTGGQMLRAAELITASAA
jgi:hypothetical protein